MNKSLLICDRVIYGAFLVMICFLPFSFAMIETCQIIMIVVWGAKRLIIWKMPQQTPAIQGANLNNGMGWALLAIALFIVLTLPICHYPALALKKFFSRFLQQIFCMYIVTEIITSRRRLEIFFYVLLVTMGAVMLDTMVQFFSGRSLIHHTTINYDRVTGPLYHPNDLGTMLLTVLPLFLGLIMIRYRQIFLVLGITILALVMINALGLTGSRGAWVAFGVCMITFALLLFKRNLMIFVTVLLVLFFWVYGIHCLSKRIDIYSVPMTHGPQINLSLSNPFGLPSQYNAMKLLSDSSGREAYWGTAMTVIKQHPLFGCGYNNYIQTLQEMRLGHDEYPHNSLLHITAELGIIGLLLHLWFFGALFWEIGKAWMAVRGDPELFVIGAAIAAGILGWFVHSLMDTPWTSLQLALLWWVFVGLMLSLKEVARGRRT